MHAGSTALGDPATPSPIKSKQDKAEAKLQAWRRRASVAGGLHKREWRREGPVAGTALQPQGIQQLPVAPHRHHRVGRNHAAGGGRRHADARLAAVAAPAGPQHDSTALCPRTARHPARSSRGPFSLGTAAKQPGRQDTCTGPAAGWRLPGSWRCAPRWQDRSSPCTACTSPTSPCIRRAGGQAAGTKAHARSSSPSQTAPQHPAAAPLSAGTARE